MGWAGVRELKESSLRPESDSETRLHRVQEETSREEIKLTDRRPTWSGSLTGKGKEIEKAVVSKGWEAGGSSQVCATVWSGGRGRWALSTVRALHSVNLPPFITHCCSRFSLLPLSTPQPPLPALPACPTCLPWPWTAVAPPFSVPFLSSSPALGVWGGLPHASTLQWVGEKEQRRETLSLGDRNDILT